MEEKRPVCTISKFGPKLKKQHLYRCITCHFDENETICESCAKFCHSGHQLEDLGEKVGYCWCGYGCKKCHCFCEHPVEGDLSVPPGVSRQCTFLETGRNYKSQPFFRCRNCGLTGSQGACRACALMCHKGHNTVNAKLEMMQRHGALLPNGIKTDELCSSCFCDCGDPSQHYHCKLSPPSVVPEPIPCCTFNVSGKKYIKQKSFYCLTCDPTKKTCVCESCAKVCHKGHNLIPCPSETSFCDCGANLLKAKCKLNKEDCSKHHKGHEKRKSSKHDKRHHHCHHHHDYSDDYSEEPQIIVMPIFIPYQYPQQMVPYQNRPQFNPYPLMW